MMCSESRCKERASITALGMVPKVGKEPAMSSLIPRHHQLMPLRPSLEREANNCELWTHITMIVYCNGHPNSILILKTPVLIHPQKFLGSSTDFRS